MPAMVSGELHAEPPIIAGRDLMGSDVLNSTVRETRVDDHTVIYHGVDGKEAANRLPGAPGGGGSDGSSRDETPWGPDWGVVRDRYGVRWMVNCPPASRAPARGDVRQRVIHLMVSRQSSATGDAGNGPFASNRQLVHDEVAQKLREHSGKKGMRFNTVITVIEIGGALALFHVARGMGASDVASYLAGSAGPVVGGVAVWAKARKFSGASAAIFAFTAVSAIIAVAGSTAPRILLYKDCAATSLVGLIFLGSCLLAPKPVAFYMAQRYGTDGTHEGMANFDVMWDTYGDFRTGMYVISYVWAALFLLQGAGTALIIRRASYSTAWNYDQILPLVAVAVGIVASIGIGRHFTTRARRRVAAASAAHSDST